MNASEDSVASCHAVLWNMGTGTRYQYDQHRPDSAKFSIEYNYNTDHDHLDTECVAKYHSVKYQSGHFVTVSHQPGQLEHWTEYSRQFAGGRRGAVKPIRIASEPCWFYDDSEQRSCEPEYDRIFGG